MEIIMRNIYVTCIATIVLSLISTNVLAAHGLEPSVKYRDRSNDLTCHIYQNYIVHIYGASDDEAPMRIYVYNRKSRITTQAAEDKNKRSICFESKKQILSITPKWDNYYFAGIKNEYLFWDSGTSTNRTLSIYNLETKKHLQDIALKDYVLLDNLLLYFKFSKHITKNDKYYLKCFNEINVPYGLAIEKLVIFDLNNNVERETSEIQCAYYE